MPRPSFPMRLAYNVAITATWPLAWLYYALRVRTDGKYLGNHRARLGLAPPPDLAGDRPRIWLHALSVGETASATSLVRALRDAAPEAEIVFSNATETGHETARDKLGGIVDLFFFLPHDYPFAVRTVVERVKPSVFVLIETDIWLNLQGELESRNVPAILVNGRISPRSHARLLRIAPLARRVYGLFDKIFVQSSDDRARFRSLGLPAQSVAMAGNIKFDAALPVGIEASPMDFAAGGEQARDRRVWIAGSTHAGEEEMLLEAHRKLGRVFDNPLLILAPRDVRRSEAVERLCRAAGFIPGIRSRDESAEGRAVFLLDTLGELKDFYGAADAAFIGGSLVPFGGHNPLEATAHGVPSCWGPHLFNFREIEAGLLDGGAGVRVESAENLAETIERWFSDLPARRLLRDACRDFVRRNAGASSTIARYVARKIPGRAMAR